ncbi:hypothetical protein DFQ14_102214 [Halopolyspora algeriensis]|uniref:MFS transporter n=1 Tax=Halopolyspora algeriensis TaxID=1500506 RepID=A0A368VVP1_9ACTN|nr:hypothetical protein DFQ14_102214 [Halopolyspora algeriensis]
MRGRSLSTVRQSVLVPAVIGVGIGLACGAMPALITAAVPVSETAANRLNTLMRSIDTSTSSAVAGVVLAQMTAAVGSVTLPSQNDFRVTMAIDACAAPAALAIAAFLPCHRPAGTTTDSQTATATSAEAPATG